MLQVITVLLWLSRSQRLPRTQMARLDLYAVCPRSSVRRQLLLSMTCLRCCSSFLILDGLRLILLAPQTSILHLSSFTKMAVNDIYQLERRTYLNYASISWLSSTEIPILGVQSRIPQIPQTLRHFRQGSRPSLPPNLFPLYGAALHRIEASGWSGCSA